MAKWFSAISTAVTTGIILVVLALACQLLPYSPFQTIMSNTNLGAFSEYLPAIAYFLPIQEVTLMLEVWVTCITEYFLWKIIFKVTCAVSSSGTSLIPKS
jgi:hypothetical protein